MPIRWRYWGAFVALSLALAGCGGNNKAAVSEPTPTPTVVTLLGAVLRSQGQQPSRPSAAGQVISASPDKHPSTQEMPVGKTVEVNPAAPQSTPGGSISLSGFEAGLEKLQSYRLRALLDFVGTDGANGDAHWQAEFLEEVDRLSGLRHLRYTTPDLSSTPGGDFYLLGETLYQMMSEGEERTCTVVVGSTVANIVSMSRPEEFLFGLEREPLNDMLLVESGAVLNGVVVDRYQMARVVSLPDLGEIGVSSEAWVAQNGGYVVSFRGVWSGVTDTLLERQGKGELKMEYVIEAVNALPTIELPSECGGLPVASSLPLPANAQNDMTTANLVMFTTPDAPETIADFYRAAMPVAGWLPEDEQNTGGELMLSYRRGDERAIIRMRPIAAGVSVLIFRQ